MERREYTTKQVVVPAKYMLSCIARDPETKYPVEINILGRYGSCYQVNNKTELEEACRTKMYFENGVASMAKRNGRFSIDLKQGGCLTIKKELLPMRRHLDTLTESQVRELYQALFSEA